MKIKHIILALSLMGFFSFSVYAEDPIKIESEVKDLKFYNSLKVEKVKDKEANKILKNYFSEYKKNIKLIDKEMEAYKKDILKQIGQERKEGLKESKFQNSNIDKNCTEEAVKDEAVFNECQKLKENLFEITEGLKELDVKEKNEINRIDTDKLNRMSSLYVQYINNVNSLKEKAN